ncbi:tetratricopeptide repeat protein [Umezawaea sp. Da 62-37]|uniref:tetratricopeptide repeat protein n=1 Tax=Umezawaea sp. Da 62-37 TaxID=3075927 RepID=UPI0028F73DA5|nr:tetratricopeptide repeat protein [Umezawaea sp. Da 62-37]WNV91694.1 tetratricopeptide repeat protein [Umezawaea sp. Da 62-37]
MNVHDFHIDPETLHETPDHPAELATWLDEQRPDDHHSWSAVGLAARLLRRLDQAEDAANRALALRPTTAARLRRAHVLQWQGRFPEANAEFEACLADAGDLLDYAHQHAGKCHYDQGRWDLALEHFHKALRLRTTPDLVASTELAIDAADACLTAATTATELHRLVPAVHRASGPRVVARITDRPPHLGLLADLASLLVTGPVPRETARNLHRYTADIDTHHTQLAEAGWLTSTPDEVTATPRCLPVLHLVNEVHAEVATTFWPTPIPIPIQVDHPMAKATTGPSPAAHLFDQLRALRHHRADAHAHAWSAEGLTAQEMQDLPADTPTRIRIEATTNRLASRPYRPLTRESRTNLITALRTLADKSTEPT